MKGCVWHQFDLFRNLFHAMRKSKFGFWARIFQGGGGLEQEGRRLFPYIMCLDWIFIAFEILRWNLENIIFYPSTFLLTWHGHRDRSLHQFILKLTWFKRRWIWKEKSQSINIYLHCNLLFIFPTNVGNLVKKIKIKCLIMQLMFFY